MTTIPKADSPSAFVSKITFSDSTSFEFSAQDIVVIVGPNNAGKSATLRGIRDKLADPKTACMTFSSLNVVKRGSLELVENWGKKQPQTNASNPVYFRVGHGVLHSRMQHEWQTSDTGLGQLSRWFCHFLSADERLQICNPASNIPLTKESPNHPIHFLQRDDALEQRLSERFRRAFGCDLVVNRNAGSQVPLHIGQRPSVRLDEDRVSLSYIERLESLPTLHTQGDGMRSFAGILLGASVGEESILLIDEPEAFLHPPQARLLGTTLIQYRGECRQLFIATHSNDVLRGILDANCPNVRVLRIRRDGEANKISLLDNDRITALWGDPLLRYSNVLDGLFHESVVLCEADSDCRFYAAVLTSTLEATRPDQKQPDLLFSHCGGKARLPLVIKALYEVDVPVKAIADFDVLSDEQPLRAIVEAFGRKWAEVEQDWKIVKTSIDAKRPDLDTQDVKREIDRILNSVTTPALPEAVRADLQHVLRRSSAWSQAKLVGRAFVPSGDATRACDRLLTTLRTIGLYVVDVGELESFVKTESSHGPKWVNSVLTRSLVTDPELEDARRFALALVGNT